MLLTKYQNELVAQDGYGFLLFPSTLVLQSIVCIGYIDIPVHACIDIPVSIDYISRRGVVFWKQLTK